MPPSSRAHDDGMWQTVEILLQQTPGTIVERAFARELATLPMRMGGFRRHRDDSTGKGSGADRHGPSFFMAHDRHRQPGSQASGNTAGSAGLLPFPTRSSGRYQSVQPLVAHIFGPTPSHLGSIIFFSNLSLFARGRSRLIWFLSVVSVNTNFDGAQPQVCVGGRPPTSGVEDNSERSTSSIGEVGETQFTVSRFEAFAGTQEAGPPVSNQGRSVRPVLCPKCNGNQCFPTRLLQRRAREVRICFEDCGRGRRNVHPRQNCSHKIFPGEIRENAWRVREGRGFVGEGGSFVQGRAPTIASVVGKREGDAVAYRTTSCSKCRCGNGDQSDAGHHRQLAGRVDEIARKWGNRHRCLRRRAHDGFATCQENQVGRWRRQQILGINFWHRSCVRGRWIISQEAFLRDVRTFQMHWQVWSSGYEAWASRRSRTRGGARLPSFRPMMNRWFQSGTWLQGSRPHRLTLS